MADPIRHVQVRIAGIACQLVAAEDEEQIRQIALAADEMVRTVQQSVPHLSQSMATILALVNAMDELSQVRQQLASLAGKKEQTEQQLQRLQDEFGELREQNFDLRKEQLELKRLISDYEKHLALILQAADLENEPEIALALKPEPIPELAAESVSPLFSSCQDIRQEDSF